MQYIGLFDNFVNKTAVPVLNNIYVKSILVLLLGIYAGRFAPALPDSVTVLIQNTYVKLFVLSLIMYLTNKSPSTSILLAIAFLVTMNYANNKPLFEFLDNVSDISGSAATASEAAQIAATTLNAQTANPTVVQTVSENVGSTIVQPQIVQTASGPTVVVPTVTIAPAVVSTPDGTKVTIKPNVVVIGQSENTPLVANTPAVTSNSPTPDIVGCFPARTYNITQIVAMNENDEVQTFTPSA